MRKLIVINIIVSILVSCNSSDEKKKMSLNDPKPSEVKKEVITSKKYEDQKGRFRIDFPCSQVLKDSILSNNRYLRLYYCEINVGQINHLAYTLSYYDLINPKEYNIENEVLLTAKESGAQVLENKRISHQGYEGKESKSLSSVALMKSRFFQVGNRIYKLQVGTLPSRGENKEMYDFLNSFEIID